MQSVLADAEGRVFAGFWSTGLCRIDTRTGAVRFFHPPAARRSAMSDNIWRVLDAGDGEILVATNDGAFLFDARRETFVPLSDRVPGAGLGQVSDAVVDAAGGLWLASPTSVEHVDRRAGVVRRFAGDAAGGGAIVGSFVDALHVDARGHLWVGTERGISCLDASGRRLAAYGVGDGLPNPNVVSITEDASGNVWAGTYGGLARLRGAVESPAAAAVLAFDERDGVTSRIAVRGAAFRSRGELYFGTARGPTRFRPRFETNTARAARCRADGTADRGPAGHGRGCRLAAHPADRARDGARPLHDHAE
ncbi:MAG: two-component regulator propeller domain-containing protein [Vicinamibacteria bacterium]